ncbi:TPA: YjdJ family protein [Bacillus thuringiensis]|uniref:YjdJ family protein n=1 Tax=Bacillus cereus group TaxID=86661 RepID=UPI0009430FFD|nr:MULTISPECIES: YjdJ family protein [Bacillus cereus group]MCU4843960.1 YjdJ family protein [Bacillus cereus]HDR4762674.1 YjdJ family protein [Bacillus cereus]HDR4793989.1 YjdJ family protein [Bacillus cereus]HDR4802058.1 YjdJ family protein [Bacillus cereus]HDR4807963.1 YjdJ family protein [Bacillus cereus]
MNSKRRLQQKGYSHTNARYNNHKIGGGFFLTINQMVQLGSSFMLFITSALISWYQGSNLIDYPDEWKYSAKFTNYFKGTVSNYQDIYQIDFFIYAAKFYPTAFVVMLISLLYMLILILHILFTRKDQAI